VSILTSHFANQPHHDGLDEALSSDAPTTVCAEAHATISLDIVAQAVAEARAPAAPPGDPMAMLSRQVGELGLDIAERREVIDAYEQLKGFVHAGRTAYDHRLTHWHQLDADTRPPRPECPQALEDAERRMVEMQPEYLAARDELAELNRRDRAMRDRLNTLVTEQGNAAADAAIEQLRSVIAKGTPALMAICTQSRLVREKFPQRADEALRLCDAARALCW
jgi:hypothetical protein